MSFALLLIPVALLGARSIDPQCQRIIDSNSETISLIRTIQIKYAIVPYDQAVREKFGVSKISWSREGHRERIRRVAGIAPRADGRPLGISDFLIDGTTYKWLSNWDPVKPQRVTPDQQGTMRASVGPQTNQNAESVAPSQQLLLEVDASPRRTLSEMARVSPSVACKGTVDVDGRKLWWITLESPEETTATTTKRFYDVYLDPAAGYLIRKLVVKAPKVIYGDGTTGKDEHQHEVVEFKDFGDGALVPVKVRHGSLKKWLSELVVESIEVNKPIAAETFEMRWPKYAAVHYYPPVDGKVRFDIWGDGKPLKSFNGPTDLRVFEAELRRDPVIAAELGPLPGAPPPPPASLMVKLSIALGALVAVMIGLVLYRRIREQATA